MAKMPIFGEGFLGQLKSRCRARCAGRQGGGAEKPEGGPDPCCGMPPERSPVAAKMPIFRQGILVGVGSLRPIAPGDSLPPLGRPASIVTRLPVRPKA